MRISLVLSGLLGLSAAAELTAAPTAELSASGNQEEGEYGTGQRVATLTVRSAVRFEQGGLYLYGALPWHRIEAPGNVVGGGGLLGLPIVIDPTQPGDRLIRSGWGDLRVGGGYRFAAPAGVDVAVGGELKLPTASARQGLGTGETDVSISGELSRRFGAVTPFAALSYTLPGDPEGYRLGDSLALRGGVAARLAGNLQGSIAYGRAQSVSPLVPDEESLSTGVEIGLSRRLSLGLHGSAGLSAGSPDFGAGLRIGWRVF